MADNQEDQLKINSGPEQNANKEISVEISDETDAPAAAALEQEDPVKALSELRASLEAERKARYEAEQRARQEAERANWASRENDDSNLRLITGAIDTMQREQGILKLQLKEAMAASDFDRAAELQEVMSSNAAKLLQLENGKAAMQAQPRQQAVAPQDPVERFAAQLSPRSADWIRRNPQFVTDQRLHQKMVAAHNLVVADGHAPDTDGYFEAVEDILKVNRATQARVNEQTESPLSAASKPVSRSAAPAAAPVNRESSYRRNTMTLSAREAQFAKEIGMSPEDYAKNKLALQKAGRLPN